MLRPLLIVAILFATDAAAGEIVYRSPTSGTLPANSDSVPPLEPEQPAFAVRYEPIQVAVGASISVMPVGDIGGYVFSVRVAGQKSATLATVPSICGRRKHRTP